MSGRWLLGLGMVLLSGSLLFGTVTGGVKVAQAQISNGNDAQIEADAHKALDNKKFQNVNITVQNGNVTLAGTVDVYAEKQDADKRIHHVKRVKGVDNEIEIAGATVDDSMLRDKLSQALAYNRVGYGTTAFNAITIQVQNGVVTLGGTVYGPTDRDSAISVVENAEGVKDVIDHMEVAPVSPMDDRLRIELARVIYGTPQLQKYALDTALPIRITVVNGNVTLSGAVDNKMDRDIAGLRANGVPGIFKVTNDLQVAGPQSGK